MVSRIFLVFTLVVLSVVFATAQSKAMIPKDLTLSEALEIALRNSSTLQEALANLEQASGQYKQSRSELLPQVDVRAHQGYLKVNLQGFGLTLPDQPSVLGPFSSMDARVLLRQDLLNIANIRSWQSYSSRRDSSRLLVEDAREVVALNVVGAYLQALTAKANRDTVAEQVRLATELYRLTVDRFDQGAASQLDTVRAKQQVNSREQQRQEAEQGYVAAKLSLANFLQANVTADFEVSDQAAYGSGDTMNRDATVRVALESRADYRAAQAGVRAAELQVKAVEATRLPTVRMTFGEGQSGTTFVHNVNVYNLQGTVEFPIFTSGRISGEIQEAQGALRAATAALDRDRAQIEADVLAAVSGVEWALKEVETSAQNMSLSRQELDLSRTRFSEGVADNTEVVNAQDRLTQADSAHIRAQYTLGVARANLARALGGAERAYRK
jgi:outer membrane protein TolC